MARPRITRYTPAHNLTRKKLRVLLSQPHFQLFHCWLQHGLNIPVPIHGNYFHMEFAKFGHFRFFEVPEMPHYKIGVRICFNDLSFIPNIGIFPIAIDADDEVGWEEEGLVFINLGNDLDPYLLLTNYTPEGEGIGIIPFEDQMMRDLKAIRAKMNMAGKAFLETFLAVADSNAATLMEGLRVPEAKPEADYTQADEA